MAKKKVSVKNSKRKTIVQSAENCKPGIKPKKFDKKQDEMMAGVFKAMSHPVRVRMLRLIGENREELCACEIESHFSLRQPTISHHLKLLKNAELIQAKQVGSWVYYSLSKEAPVNVKNLLKKEM